MGLDEELLQFTERGLLPAVIRCLKAGAGTDARDVCAFTPLIRAAYDNSQEIAQCLVEAGADVHATCEEGWTAAAYAIQNGHFQMALFLAEHGANLDYLEFEMGEDLPPAREPMEKIISRAAGRQVWLDWSAYLLERSTPEASSSPPRPRL